MQRVSGFLVGVVLMASLSAFAQTNSTDYDDEDVQDETCMLWEVEGAACDQSKSILLEYVRVLESQVEPGRIPTARAMAQRRWRANHPGPHELPPPPLARILRGED